MRILATSDMHGCLDGLDLSGIDIALFAGDIAPLRDISSWDAYDQLKWMNHDFYDFCVSWPDVKIKFVPGNHDFFPVIKETFGYKLHAMNLNMKLAPNAEMLVDKSSEITAENGSKMSIYGTPWVPVINYRWAFEAEHDKLVKKFAMIPENIDILITHAPPRFNNLGVSLEYGNGSENFGSHELAEEIFKKSPKFCFCGHVHSGDHQMNILENTQIWNVSRVNESYEIAYDPLVMDV